MVLINSFSHGVDNDKKASICITNANPIIMMNLDYNELEEEKKIGEGSLELFS